MPVLPAAVIEEKQIEAPNTGDETATTEEIKEATPEPDSAAKPKKEKVKKKSWSFRSLSFGRKDKQKPSKKDKKNEDNKAVAESAEEKVGEDADESKPAETVEDKPQASEAVVETKPLEPVAETVVVEEVKPMETVRAATAPAPKPVVAIVEPVKEKTPEPIAKVKTPEPIIVTPPQEEIFEAPAVVVEAPIETPAAIIEEPEVIAEPIVEEPPAIPASPPPSQFSVFAENMNKPTAEETLPEPIAEVEVEVVFEVSDFDGEIDVKPVADMIEKVLEAAVEQIEAAELAQQDDDEELPPPPAEEQIESPPVAEVIVEVKQNGVGEHTDEPVVKV